MKDIEKLLKVERERIETVRPPEDMEEKLREALAGARRKKKKLRLRIACLILAVFLVGYNMDSLAQYGRRLIGYEAIMKGSLRELNQMGKGQEINKSYEFSGGERIKLDLVMLDDNNMILFYSLYDPKGRVEDFYNDLVVSLEKKLPGMFGSGGSGKTSKDGKEMRWVLTMEGSPKFFQRNLKLVASLYKDGRIVERGEIPFKIDRKQALGRTMLVDINKKIRLGDRRIKIKSLRASPTSTRIEGQVQNIIELGLDHMAGTRLMVDDIELALVVNGLERGMESAAITTDMKGMYFRIDFDSLPQDLESLEIRLKSLTAAEDIKERIPLVKGQEENLQILNEKITIKNVYEKDGHSYIDISSEDTTRLGQVFLNIDGRRVELDSTADQEAEKILEDGKVKIINNRTLKFKGTGENLILEIDRIRFKKTYDRLIYKDKFK